MVKLYLPNILDFLVLGKPRYPESFTDDEYKIKLIDRNNCGLYSIEVSKK